MHALEQCFKEPVEEDPVQALGNPPDKTFGIFFTARSGSSWLAQLADSTGALGEPYELFNPNRVPAIRRRIGGRDPMDYADRLQRKRQTPNGIFGVQVTPFQIRPMLDNGTWFQAFPSMSYIILTRRDIVQQAISLWLKQTTGVAHTGGQHAKPDWHAYKHATYEPAAIYLWMRRILQGEYLIERFVSNRQPLRITYEELVRAPRATVRRIGEQVGVTCRPRIDKVTRRKVSGPRNRDWAQRFRAEYPELMRIVDQYRGRASLKQLERSVSNGI